MSHIFKSYIWNLIDDIQDQAASQLGNDVVFKEFWEDEEE